MLRSVNSLKNYYIKTNDGEIGVLKSFHFDDRDFHVKYLVIDIGKALNPKEVLILPSAAYELSLIEHSIKVNLSIEQVKHAKPFISEVPVAYEYEVFKERNLDSLFMIEPWTGSLMPLWFTDKKNIDELIKEVELNNNHLQCTEILKSYTVYAKDTDSIKGTIIDFIIDEDDWKIKYLVVDINKFLPYTDILIPIDLIDGFNYFTKAISLNINSEELKKCPKYDANEPVNRSYALEFYDYEGNLIQTKHKNVDDYYSLDQKLHK